MVSDAVDRFKETIKSRKKILEENKVVTFRGCQLDGGKTDVCETVKTKAKKGSVTIASCDVCKEDACNKSTSLQIINLWLLLAPLILVKFLV